MYHAGKVRKELHVPPDPEDNHPFLSISGYVGWRVAFSSISTLIATEPSPTIDAIRI